jgi:two-component system, NtrC family, nitrogen regulation sensor histidine kinase NtrY
MLTKGDRIIAFIAVISLIVFSNLRVFFHLDSSREEIVQFIEERLDQQLKHVDQESTGLIDLKNWEKVTHSFFLVEDGHVIRWNKNDFLPDLQLLQDSTDIRWIRSLRGDFIVKKIESDSNRLLFAVTPLIEQYKIANNFLRTTWNTALFPFDGIQIIDPASSTGLAVKNKNAALFYIQAPDLTESVFLNEASLHFFWWIGIVALLVILVRVSQHYHRKGKSIAGFLFLSACLIFIRIVCIYFNIPNIYYSYNLFDPRVFASSFLSPSIGDLLLNTGVVLILSIYAFATYDKWKSLPRVFQYEGGKRIIILTLLASISFFAILFPYFYFETIFHNSSISLDVTQSLQFDFVRVVAFLCVVGSYLATFFILHVMFQLFLKLSDHRLVDMILFLSIGTIVFIIAFFLLEKNYWTTLSCSLIYFTLIFLFRFPGTFKHVSFKTFFYLLTVILLFAIQAALSVKKFAEEKRINAQFHFANEFLVGRDFLGEFLLNETIGKIKEDPFIQNSFFNPFFSKATIKQKIRQVYLNNYFDRYDITIHVYNSVGEPIDSEPFFDFASQVQLYQDQFGVTPNDGVYFITNAKDQVDRKYLVVAPIERLNVPVGFVVLELSIKKIIPRNVYPELLVDNRFAVYLRSREYSFAVYSQGNLVSSFGDFNYEKDIRLGDLSEGNAYTKGVQKSGYIHAGVEDDDNRVAIVSTLAYPAFYVLGNFSFWTITGFLIVLLGLIYQGIYYWIKGEQLNYSSRVQLYLYSSLLLPLLAVSVSTLGIITNSAASRLNEEFIHKSKLLAESLTSDLATLIKSGDINKEDFEQRLLSIARVSDVDATVYDSAGYLIASSQPLIFDYEFKSELIDRTAWEKVVYDKEVSLVRQDQIGSLKYFSAFCALRSPQDGHLLGIVSLPFFESLSSLEKTRINILINILSIFTAVLLGFSVLSLLAANQLTYPFRIIAKSLSRTTLTGYNEPLAWNSTDEIGVMVKEYNKMVQNLDQSKIELARSQKESAWREMAKQVAHEIKNPLTPMKLSLQQMEQLLKTESTLPKDKAERSIKTMLSQVEILDEIASSFGTFARMPAPVMAKVELNAVLKKITDLYANNQSGKVNWFPMNESAFIMGDEQLLIRVFSNIILNALQAGESDLTIVNVKLTREDNRYGVIIEDNAKGISPELTDKIFLPYFSTKKSGSGLGLAIVKQGVEQMGGSIYLESVVGVGTTFYIQFQAN